MECPMRVLTFALTGLLLAASSPAFAQSAGDPCAAFAWPMTKEKIILSRAPRATVSAGSAIDHGPPTGFRMMLMPAANVAFVLAPGKASPSGAYAGTLHLGEPPADGDYLVTLSGDAWIDVIQGHNAVPSIAVSRAKDCPGMQLSVKFHLKAYVPLVLQISAAHEPQINVAITPAEYFDARPPGSI